MITLEMAETYFANHMDAAYWSSLGDAAKSAALAMANNDIAAQIGVTEVSDRDRNGYFAVCEQAVYLARNYARQATGKEVVGQSLDGVGSQTFQLLNTDKPGISPRALSFIAQARKDALGGSIRISRG